MQSSEPPAIELQIMSADGPNDNGREPASDFEETPRSWRAAAPFLIAAGAAVLVLIVVLLSAVFRPAEERISDDAKVQFVVNDMYSARSALNYDLFRNTHCEKDLQSPTFPTSQEFADVNRTAREKDGKLVIPEMKVEVVGDRAKVSFDEHRERNEAQKTRTELTLVKSGDDWKVCSA